MYNLDRIESCVDARDLVNLAMQGGGPSDEVLSPTSILEVSYEGQGPEGSIENSQEDSNEESDE